MKRVVKFYIFALVVVILPFVVLCSRRFVAESIIRKYLRGS
jgi:hypothetical protein